MIVALPSAEIAPAAAVKVAVVVFAGMLTEAGTLRDVLLEFNDTVVVPLSAALDSVSVQVVLPLDARLEAPHCTDVRLTGP